MNSNLKWEKLIFNISFVGSIIFLISEIIVAILTNSNAVLMDCVYDIADLLMIGPFLVLIPLLYKPITEKKPYGFSQIESLFILLKSAILIGITGFLILESVKLIIAGGNEVDASFIAIFEIAVSMTCVIMYLILKRLSKNYTSPSIKAELYIWKLDAFSTLGVGVAFLIKLLIDNTSIGFVGPYIDPSIAIVLAILLLKEPLGLFIESLKNLVLFSPDNQTHEKIRQICEKHLDAYECYINFLDIIKTGRRIWVEVYFVTNKDLISITKIKQAHAEILKDLLSNFENVSVELIPDVDEVKEENKIKLQNTKRPDKVNYINKKEIKRNNKKVKKKK